MNVLDFVWTYKIKHFPNRSLQKLKTRFCVKSFQQIEGVDYFETYSPVISWLTVCLVFTIFLLLNLQSIQVDYTEEFPQAPLTNDVYIKMPRGYRKNNKAYKLKRNLYGLKQAARNLFDHLKDKLIKQGFHQNQLDLCLFLNKEIMILVYVDSCIFFSPKKDNITIMLNKLWQDGLEIKPKHNMAVFFGCAHRSQ